MVTGVGGGADDAAACVAGFWEQLQANKQRNNDTEKRVAFGIDRG